MAPSPNFPSPPEHDAPVVRPREKRGKDRFEGRGGVEHLRALDAYLDAAPRPDSDTVEIGAFTLFVSHTPWTYYARPRPTHHGSIPPGDLDALAAACADHDVEVAFEWVHELHPELAGLADEAGLTVSRHALMSAHPDDLHGAEISGAYRLRIPSPDDPALVEGLAVAEVAFAADHAEAVTGARERDACAARLPAALVAHGRDRARRGLTITAVAESAEYGVVAAGSHQPAGGFSEVLAVATLPCARNQGLASAITAHLAHHAFAAGNQTVLLSAQNDTVERLYARLGFRRVGTAMAAETPAGTQAAR